MHPNGGQTYLFASFVWLVLKIFVNKTNQSFM
jgi:hypothetical protein